MLCFYRGSLNTEVTDRKDKVINTLLKKLEKKNHEEISPSRATTNGSSVVQTSSVIQGTYVDIGLVNELLFFRSQNAVYEFIEGIFKEYKYCKKIKQQKKKHFIKNLIISEEEHLF